MTNSKNNSRKKITNIISEEKDINTKEIDIIGIYDPSDNDLSINLWSYSDGEKILGLINKIKKLTLSWLENWKYFFFEFKQICLIIFSSVFLKLNKIDLK